MKLGRIIILCTTLGIPALAQAEISLPDLGEPYQSQISYQDIQSAILNGDLQYALNLATDLAIQKARQALNDQKNIHALITLIASQLQNILNDTTKTDAQKSNDVIELIENSIGAQYQSSPAGSINLTFTHSIEYGVTRLTWSQKTAHTTCDVYYYRFVCDDFGENCHNELFYTKEYWTRVPTYSIYRVIDGQQELLTRLEGYQETTNNTFQLNSDIWKDIKNAIDFYRHIPTGGVSDGQAVWYDFNSDYHNAGHTLSYKVAADNPQLGQCAGSEHYESTAFVDSDGDGRADFIPSDEYAKLFGKYYGWLVPTLSIVQQ